METDLVILSPDGAWPAALGALLSRPQSMGIRQPVWKFVQDPLRDSSPQSVELLRPYLKTSRFALVVRDFHGSGWEDKGKQVLDSRLRDELTSSGWESSRVDILIAEPELEGWLRLDSSHVHTLLVERAKRNREGISQWKEKLEEGYGLHGGLSVQGKAKAPKEVFHHVLRHYGIPPSNALFTYLAGKESLRGCVVPFFIKFVKLMQEWFPVT